MLRLMRKHARAWFMQVLLGIIIIVFVFYFGSLRGRRQAETVAKVNDTAIGYLELKNEYQRLLDFHRQRYKGTITDDILKSLNLKQRALDNLINQAVILSRADELQLAASDEEVRAAIYSYPAFQKDGVFDINRYHQMIRYHRMSPEDFEAMQEKSIVIGKVETLIKEAIKVSDREVLDIYRIQNEKINIEFIKIYAGIFKKQVHPTDDDLKSYLGAHGEDFRVPRKVQVKYIAFLAKDYADLSGIQEKDIKDYYEDHKSEFLKSETEVHPLATVRDKVIEKLKFIRGMDNANGEAKRANDLIYQEENFEEYAKEHALKISATSFFSKDAIPKELKRIDNVEKYIFAIEEGETAPLLANDEGFYILKVHSIKPSYIPGLEEARARIQKSYTDSESKILSEQKAGELLSRLKQGEDFQKVAQQEGLTAGETGLFLPGPNMPLIGSSLELGQALFVLSKKDPYPEKPFYINDSYVIVRFKERGELNLDDFESQKDTLKKILVRFKEEEQFRLWLETTKEAMIQNGTLKIMADLNNI